MPRGERANSLSGIHNEFTGTVLAVDGFCKVTDKQRTGYLLNADSQKRQRTRQLSDSEALTIFIRGAIAPSKLISRVCTGLFEEKIFIPHHLWTFCTAGAASAGLAMFVSVQLLWVCRRIIFVDAVFIAVCDNRRINQHKVFKGIAACGKDSTGWSFSFKLHVVVNEYGELLAIYMTTANHPELKALPKLVKRLFDKLFADMV